MNQVNVDSVKCKSLSLVNDAGKEVAVLKATEDAQGLWITSATNSKAYAFVGIENGNPVLSVANRKKACCKANQIAFSVDADGEPVVQLMNGKGKIVMLSFKDLEKLLHICEEC